MKRTGKFYRKNEQEVMKSLGLKPTLNSGSFWLEKEDGENDFILAQLKSTDKQNIVFSQKDFRILECNATTAHKIPVFMLQFLNTDEVFLVVRPHDIQDVVDYIQTGKCEQPKEIICNLEIKSSNKKKIKSAGREEYWQEKEKEVSKWLKGSKSKR